VRVVNANGGVHLLRIRIERPDKKPPYLSEKIFSTADAEDLQLPTSVNGRIVFAQKQNGYWSYWDEDGSPFVRGVTLLNVKTQPSTDVIFQATVGNVWVPLRWDGRAHSHP